MKKGIKLMGAGIVTIIAGVFVYRKYRKELARLEKLEKSFGDEMKCNGVDNNELLRNNCPADGDNLVKALYTSIEFSTDWDLDMIDVPDILGENEIIHVQQSTTDDGRTDTLDFLLEIPETVGTGKYDLRVGDYITSLISATNYMHTEIIKFCPKPFWRLEGHFTISFNMSEEEGAEEVFKSIKIPPHLYEAYATDRHNGLSDYVAALRNGDLGDGYQEVILPITKVLEGKVYNLKVVDVLLGFKVSFPIQSRKVGCDGLGININTALQCLRYLTDEFRVKRGSTTAGYKYMLFHPTDPDTGDSSLIWHYTVEPEVIDGVAKRKVVISNETCGFDGWHFG